MRDFDTLYRNYKDAVMRRCQRRAVSGAIDPEEASQEAWLAIWSYLPNMPEEGGVTSLIFTITDNACSALWRKVKRKSAFKHVEFSSDYDQPMFPTQESVVELRQVSDRLDRMPDHYRDMMIQVALGVGPQEMADECGVTRQAIDQRVKIVRKHLAAGTSPATGQRRLSEAEISSIRARIERGDRGTEIAAAFNVTPAAIAHIKSGRNAR